MMCIGDEAIQPIKTLIYCIMQYNKNHCMHVCNVV